jgi:type IV secretory pathway VirB4 component
VSRAGRGPRQEPARGDLAMGEEPDWLPEDMAAQRRQLRERQRAAQRAQATRPPTLLGSVGAPGPAGGRVLMRTRVPGVTETTAQLAATYPFLAEAPYGVIGPYIGQGRYSRTRWTWDSYTAYQQGIVRNPSIFVSGTVGSGKSSLVKSMTIVRAVPFGRRFIVPADQKGEYRGLARALGFEPVEFGPGMGTCLNPLEPPRVPDQVAARAEYADLVPNHQVTTLTAMAEAGMGRLLLPEEKTALDLALEYITRRSDDVGRWATPSLGEVAHALLNPDLQYVRQTGVRDAERLADSSFGLGCQIRTLVHGVFRGLFDGRTTVRVDIDAPGVVIDMSRVRNDDASLALSMTAAQAHLELAIALDPRPRYLIYDESWRVVRFYGLLRRLSAAIKLSREGHVPVVVVHRVSDLVTGDPMMDAAAQGLLADIDVRILYHQAADQIAQTQALCGLGDVEAALLTDLDQGSALWKIDQDSHLVDHVVPLGGLEWEVVQTDSRMSEDYRRVEQAGQKLAELFADDGADGRSLPAQGPPGGMRGGPGEALPA